VGRAREAGACAPLLGLPLLLDHAYSAGCVGSPVWRVHSVRTRIPPMILAIGVPPGSVGGAGFARWAGRARSGPPDVARRPRNGLHKATPPPGRTPRARPSPVRVQPIQHASDQSDEAPSHRTIGAGQHLRDLPTPPRSPAGFRQRRAVAFLINAYPDGCVGIPHPNPGGHPEAILTSEKDKTPGQQGLWTTFSREFERMGHPCTGQATTGFGGALLRGVGAAGPAKEGRRWWVPCLDRGPGRRGAGWRRMAQSLHARAVLRLRAKHRRGG
jgi:hypothetical protein